MLTEKMEYSQTYNGDCTITIKSYTVISRDGIEISRSLCSTSTICPGEDFSAKDIDTQKMCQIFWTNDIIAEYVEARNNFIAEHIEAQRMVQN